MQCNLTTITFSAFFLPVLTYVSITLTPIGRIDSHRHLHCHTQVEEVLDHIDPDPELPADQVQVEAV
jgi:hypothetical protein